MNFFKKIAALALSGALMCGLALPSMATQSNQLVAFDLWNANVNQPSMGNIAKDNNPTALYNPEDNTLQIATNPVNVSGYQSGIVAVQYDTTGNGDFVDVDILSTGTVETGTKHDGTNYTVTFLSSFSIDLPDYLTGEGVAYIPLHISVPYTPMDVVVGEGYLDAKLRIDWSQTEDTTRSNLIPNTDISSGTVAEVNLEDMGVKIYADTTMLTVNSQLTVTPVTSGDSYALAQAALGADVTDFQLYQMVVTANGTEVSPTGSIEIVFPFSDLEGLYRINTTGTKTVLRGTQEEEGYSILSRNLGLFAVVGGTELETVTFGDIAGHWAEAYVIDVVDRGLFYGTSDTAFSPETQMTNGMVIAVLHRMAGSPAATNDAAVWYGESMAWGYEQGIIGGYTTFDGEANVTREGLATMLYRYHALTGDVSAVGDLSQFADSGNLSTWAVDGLSWANAMGVVNGKTATTLAPQSLATRAEVATMLSRYLDTLSE